MKKFILISLFSLSCLIYSGTCIAQCALCKATTKSNIDNNSNKVGVGINKGVLYLMSVPYLLAGVGVFIWYRNKKQQQA